MAFFSLFFLIFIFLLKTTPSGIELYSRLNRHIHLQKTCFLNDLFLQPSFTVSYISQLLAFWYTPQLKLVAKTPFLNVSCYHSLKRCKQLKHKTKMRKRRKGNTRVSIPMYTCSFPFPADGPVPARGTSSAVPGASRRPSLDFVNWNVLYLRVLITLHYAYFHLAVFVCLDIQW